MKKAGKDGIAIECINQHTSYKVSNVLTAIHYLYSMPRGYRSRHRVTHEIMLSLLYLGLGSRVWLQC